MITRQFKYSTTIRPLANYFVLFVIVLPSTFRTVGLAFSGVKELFGVKSRTILQRTTSFFDHDKPWYAPDNVFVRYDGWNWNNGTLMGCNPGVNCYNGHNGYDLNLYYELVLSAAAGTVIRAGWYNPLNHSVAFGLWVAVNHGNGYVTAYGHLSGVSVGVGRNVGTQWRIGTSGTTGASTGPHLHFGTYYLPYWHPTDPFGWYGNYADPNVVPDRSLWVRNPGTA